MADSKISALTELTTTASEDLVAVVDDPSGTPVTKKVTLANLLPDDAVTEDKILDGAVTTNKIAAGTVSTTRIADDAVTYAKMQNVASDDVVLGRISGAAGNVEELTGAQVRTITRIQHQRVAVNSVPAGGAKVQTVTLSPAMGDTSYTVLLTVDEDSTAVGNTNRCGVSIVTGTKSSTGFDIRVTNPFAGTEDTVIQVLAIHD